MRLTLISLSTPTFNNTRAASALPYHLILAAKGFWDVKIDIYSYNINSIDIKTIKQVESELGVKIRLLDKPKWIIWMMELHMMFFRVLLRYPLYNYCKLPQQCINAIRASHSNIIWIYGEELAGLTKHFQGSNCIVTMPDCESLYYYRMLRQPWATVKLQQIMKYSFAYWQYKSMERHICKNDIIYHFVGKADAEFFKMMNPQAKTLFLRHPLYAYKNKKIKFHQPRIKLLFTGRYDFYCQHGSDDLLSSLERSNTSLFPYYEITFLGNGWEKWNDRLVNAGYFSQHIPFAPDYIAELQKHDIQVNAIDVGTGTKGKVLDGIANGLLIIGTPYAMENIAVENNKSCVIYKDTTQLISVLKEIPYERARYEAIAIEGRKCVLTEHNREKISKELFGFFS
ncbi:glycosyltransferase family protein [Prevotella intermedia]|uniref:Glycosyltransferase n=1 Tax=Prevotella intermedia TaxID=28131 RepID=A0A2D3LKS8_PREIN|nr:glycosyltransferase [Prevotella intermedia]ATV31111.1 glycosyltransferase [Prevotella intermedia]PJI22638.1 glycosyltransferase [Prevotella intermedia]